MEPQEVTCQHGKIFEDADGESLGLSPLPVTVTTRIVMFLVGDPYKPSFPLLLGGGTTQRISMDRCKLKAL